MDFYIGGGGGGGGSTGSDYYTNNPPPPTGGYPTGWDSGSPGVTGGSGGSTPSGGLSVSPNYAVNGTVSNIINTPDILKTTSMYVQNLQVSYLNALQKGDSAGASNYLKEINSIAANPYGFVAPYANFKAPTYNSPGALPDAELGLLSEYGNNVSNLYGTTYKGTDYTGPNRQSSYDAWYNAEQAKFAEAKSKPSADLPIELAKPSMPNGAPNAGDIMAEELFKLYGLDGRYDVSDKPSLSEYNPLKSDWKGKANLEGLMKGLMGSLMGGVRGDVAPAKQFESPQYGLLAKSNVNPQEAADPLKSANNQWQRTVDLKPKEYESSYLDNYVDPYVPKLEKQIGMPSLDIAAPSMFANQGLLSGMAQQSSKNETAKSKSIVDENRESVSDAINNARDRVKGLSWKQLA